MISTSHELRRKYKLAFLRRHEKLAKSAFQEALACWSVYESMSKSTKAAKLVQLARTELRYSPKTVFVDILWGLMKLYYSTLEVNDD